MVFISVSTLFCEGPDVSGAGEGGYIAGSTVLAKIPEGVKGVYANAPGMWVIRVSTGMGVAEAVFSSSLQADNPPIKKAINKRTRVRNMGNESHILIVLSIYFKVFYALRNTLVPSRVRISYAIVPASAAASLIV